MSISILVNLASIILTIFLITFLVPVSLVFLSPILIYRQIIIQCAKILKKDTLGKILTSRSSIFVSEKVYRDPINNVISLFIVEGKVDVDYLRHAFETRVVKLMDSKGELKYPELRCNVITNWCGFPFWRKLPNFDIKEMVHFYNNDGNQTTTHANAIELLKSTAFQPYSKSRPLWEIVVLPNYIPDLQYTKTITSPDLSYSGIIVRSHHGLCDAFSQLQIVQSLSLHQFEFVKPTTDYTQREGLKNVSMFSKIKHSIIFCLMVPFEFSRMIIRKMFLVERWSGLEKTNNEDFETNLSRFCGSHSPNFPLAEIQQIKNIHGVTGTAILFSALIGSIKRTLFSELSQIPSTLVLCIPLPLPHPPPKLRNHVTVGSFSVPLLNDPLERLKMVYKRLQTLKKSTLPFTYSVIMKIAGCLPSFMIRFGFSQITSSDNIIYVSNVPGPKGESDFANYPIKDFLPMSGAILQCQGLGVSFLSIGGSMRISLGADKKILESDAKAKELIDNFFEELENLRNACPQLDFVQVI